MNIINEDAFMHAEGWEKQTIHGQAAVVYPIRLNIHYLLLTKLPH